MSEEDSDFVWLYSRVSNLQGNVLKSQKWLIQICVRWEWQHSAEIRMQHWGFFKLL